MGITVGTVQPDSVGDTAWIEDANGINTTENVGIGGNSDASSALKITGNAETTGRVGVAGAPDATAALKITGETVATGGIDSAGIVKAVSLRPHTTAADLILRLSDDSKKISICKADGTEVASFDAAGNLAASGNVNATGIAKAASFRPHTTAADLILRLSDDSKKISICKADGTEVASFDATGALVAAGKSGIGGAAPDSTYTLNVAGASSIKTAGAIEVGTTIQVGGATGPIIKYFNDYSLLLRNSTDTDYAYCYAGLVSADSICGVIFRPSVSVADLIFRVINNLYDFSFKDASSVEVARIDSAGRFFPGASTAAIASTGSGVEIYDTSTLAAESLNETDFATHAAWDDTGDMNSESGYAQYTHSTGVGTLTQTAANQATAAVSGGWYQFTYTISGVTAGCTATITTAYALTAQTLDLTAGVAKTLVFKAAVAPTDFVISVTSTAGGFTIDDVSLKQAVGAKCLTTHGSLQIDGTLTTYGSASVPYLYASGGFFAIVGATDFRPFELDSDLVFKLLNNLYDFSFKDASNAEVARIDSAGRFYPGASTAAVASTGSGIEIYDTSTLAAESLNETDFATHAAWDDTGDMNSESGYAQYTHSTGVGTLTQTAANQAIAAVAGAWYKLVITFANVVAGCTAELTTAFAKTAQSINIATGAQTLYYKAAAAPTNFILSIASVASGAFRITAISNKQVTDAEVLNLHGAAKINGTITQRDSKYLGGLQHGVAHATSGALSGASGSIAVNVPDGAYITAVSLKNAVEVTGATSTTAAFAGGSTAAIGSGIANAKNTATDVVYSPAEAVSGAVATIALTPADSNYTGGEIVAVVYYDMLDSIPDFA